jgi:predicted transcriptional regulator
MPPHKSISAPKGRVYTSSAPLKQVKFPELKKRVTYGKKTSKRIRDPNQDTLTQMRWVEVDHHFDGNEAVEDFDVYKDEQEERKKKRRKTLEDQPSSDSKYQQTLTQLERSFSAAQDDEDEANSSTLRSLRARRKNVPQDPKPSSRSPSRRKSAPGNMEPPKTPHRQLAREIPSSQSPVTPQSSHFQVFPSKPSPLGERSTNIPVAASTMPTSSSIPQNPPKLKFEDTFETATDSQHTCVPTSPRKRPSPAKSVRFNLADDDFKDLPPSQTAEKALSQLSPCHVPSTQRFMKLEIQDSDAESEVEEQDEVTISVDDENGGELSETCYGDIGVETQMEAEQLLVYASSNESRILGEIPVDEGEETSQCLESQRLSTQQVDAMAPRTTESDVFVSLHPQSVQKIVDRTKNHEFRKSDLPSPVGRIWIYETAPASMLRYMAVISKAKYPGEIDREEGEGNASFNMRPNDGKNYAYEILELYELADPVPYGEVVKNGWFKKVPINWARVGPAVIDKLVANLLPPLFAQPSTFEKTPSSSSTDTQEAEAQLLSTMMQFTQPMLPRSATLSIRPERRESTSHEEFIHAIPQETPQLLRPSQASTVDLTQSQSSQHRNVAEIVWESPARSLPSSTPMYLPSPRTQGLDGSSVAPYLTCSSQLLTTSQMLPDSIVADNVPGPPFLDTEYE